MKHVQEQNSIVLYLILLTPNTKILTPVQCLHVFTFPTTAENSNFPVAKGIISVLRKFGSSSGIHIALVS